MIFYFHPSTKNAVSFFRTVPILPEIGPGRRDLCGTATRSRRGSRSSSSTARNRRPRWKLRGGASPRSMRDWSRRRSSSRADGKIQEAQSAYQQAIDELEIKRELRGASRTVAAARGREAQMSSMPGRVRSRPPRQKKASRRRCLRFCRRRRASAEAALRGGPGRAGQDRRPCRRRRHGGAVHAAQGRHRQSVDAAGGIS